MKSLTLLEELKYRGFIAKLSDENEFKKIILCHKITAYCGFDPTSDSLHVGHLLPLLCLRWFQQHGHKIIILIGYATSLIGDPSFKEKERILELPEKMINWSQKLENQIVSFFQANNFPIPIIVNNYNWFKNVNLINFLRDTGKFFSINKMISRKSVQNRINRIEQGISFTEFSYSLLQSYDFLELYKRYNVTLQIGGSDQWGNISAGINLIRRSFHTQVFGLTIPLLIQPNGIKFGKTESDTTVWLNSNKTSPYSFYQFWLNIHDNNILQFLKLFTFLQRSEIQDIQNQHLKIQDIKIILANHITQVVHGKKNLESVQRITKCLFFGKITDLTEKELYQLKNDGISYVDMNFPSSLIESLVYSKLATSRSDANRLIISKSIKINGETQVNKNYQFCILDKLFHKFTLLSKGKKKHVLLCW